MNENKKLVKVVFYGNASGPFKDTVRGEEYSDGYAVYSDGSVERSNDFEEVNNMYVAGKDNSDITCLAYDNLDKYRIDYEYDKKGTVPDKTIVAANEKGGFGAGALAAVGIGGVLLGLGAGAVVKGMDKNNDTVPDKTTQDQTEQSNEEVIAQLHLEEHFNYTDSQKDFIENLDSTVRNINERCTELGIPEASFNTEEALVFSLMMSDVSNEEAARYLQTLEMTSDQMNDYYQSAVHKFNVIQACINSEKDVELFDNLLIKVVGESNRLSKEENEAKRQQVLDAFHSAMRMNIAINNAKAEDVDKVNGSVKLADGKVLTYKQIMDFDFALLKSNKTTDMDGNTVYGFANNAAARKVFMDTVMASHFYHTTGMDDYLIGDTYNVEGNNEKGTVAKEYDELNEDACNNTIDFDEVEYLIKASNKELTDYVITLTGQSDIRVYRDGAFDQTYDKSIEALSEKYSSIKTWNELDDETKIELYGKIVEINNKLRYVTDTYGSGSYSSGGSRTVTSWTESASDVISETKEGTGKSKKEAQDELDDYYQDKKDELKDKAEKEGGEYTETEDGAEYKDVEDDGSGTYESVKQNEDGSVEETTVEAGPIVVETPTSDGDLVTQDPISGEEEHYNEENVQHDYDNEDYDPEVNQHVKELTEEAKQEDERAQAEEEQKNQEYQEEGDFWEEYFASLENGNSNENTDTNGSSVAVEDEGYEEVEQDHGPLVNTP